MRTGANVHPARLAFGLRERLIARGAAVHEGCRARAVRAVPGGVTVETATGRVRARAAVVAAGAAAGALPPLRDRLTVASSHIVCTEPVPDVIEALGWTGGEAICDGRALLHYTRTTRDGRIVFGWAGGRMAAGARTGGRMEVDHQVDRAGARATSALLPAARGAAHRPRLGRADRRLPHPPARRSRPARAAGRGRRSATRATASGPSHLLGRALAALALDRRDDGDAAAVRRPAAPRVPPEPLRVAGAAVMRRALVRKEAAEEAGDRADPVSRAVAGLPRRLGLHIVR